MYNILFNQSDGLLSKMHKIIVYFLVTFHLLYQFSYFVGLNYITFKYVCILIVLIFAFLVIHINKKTFNKKYELNRKFLFYAILTIIFITVYVFLNRPDADDEFYLCLSIEPLLMQGEKLQNLPSFQGAYALTSGEIFKSFISDLFNLPLLYVFFLLVPVFWIFLLLYNNTKLINLLLPIHFYAKAIAIIVFSLVLFFWGDIHRTHSNFGIVRIFQGKGVYVSVIIPALFMYFFRIVIYSKTVERWNSDWSMLLSYSILGISQTPTAVVCNTLLLGIFCSIHFFNRKKSIILLINYSIIIGYTILMGIITVFYFNESGSGQMHIASGSSDFQSTYNVYLNTLAGDGFRGYFILISLLCVPFIMKNKIQKVTFFILPLLLIFPYTSYLISIVYDTATWRWMWIIPFPIIVALIAGRIWDIKEDSFFAKLSLIMILLLFAFTSNKTIFHKENGYAGTRIEYSPVKWFDDKIYLRSFQQNASIENGRITIDNKSL